MAYHKVTADEPSPPWPWWTDPTEYMGTTLWTNCKSKDFQIVVGDLVLDVHKCVLAARSPVFSAMLNSGLNETKSGQLDIQDFGYDIVQTAIMFCYSESFDIVTIEAQSIWNLLSFGHKYDIGQLTMVCLHKIKMWKDNYTRGDRKFLISSAVYLGCDYILDEILNIFGTIIDKLEKLVFNKCPYKAIGYALVKDDSFKDLKIICSGQEFFVHKCILALKSQVFTQIFDKMAENDDTSGQLNLDGIKPIVVEKAVKFFYTGTINIPFKENPDLILGLLEFADKYKVEQLVSLCLKKIYRAKKNLNIGIGQEVVLNCIKTAVNFDSKKIINIILGIFGTHGFGPLDFDIEKASSESYWD